MTPGVCRQLVCVCLSIVTAISAASQSRILTAAEQPNVTAEQPPVPTAQPPIPAAHLPVAAASAATEATHPPPPRTVQDVLGDTPASRQLEQSLSPYLAAAAGDGGSVVSLVPVPEATSSRPEYALGKDLILMPSAPAAESVPVTLPQGYWVNFWTGAQSTGGITFLAEIPAGVLPLWARGGSVLERRTGGYQGRGINFEKALRDNATACGESCLFDMLPPYSWEQPEVIRDTDGRTITRSGVTLALDGKAAHVTVRWRFTRVTNVRLNGVPLRVQTSPEGYYATFDHSDRSTLEWTVHDGLPRSY